MQLPRRCVRYCLIGAAAMAVRGHLRHTLDVDLPTTDRRVLEDGFWAGFIDHVEVRRGDDRDPLWGVVRFMGRFDLDDAAHLPKLSDSARAAWPKVERRLHEG